MSDKPNFSSFILAITASMFSGLFFMWLQENKGSEGSFDVEDSTSWVRREE